jgi:pilus assembly protein FimV
MIASLGRIQLARGDARAARNTLERALAADANEPSVRESLSDLYLKQNEPDRALDMVTPLVERALGRGERASAVEMLNRIIRVESGHAPTLERLVAVYTRLNEETNILSSMAALAEAHVARMRFDEASKVLERLIQREPQNAQHRNKLQFVKTQMGGVDTMPVREAAPARPAAAPVRPPMEIDEPVPSFELPEDLDDSISLDLDASESLDLDLEMDTVPAAPARTPVAPPPPQYLMSAVEMVAADLAENGEDIDFITEHLTEAEVFAKYGLAEKAAEHLRAILERAPKNLTAHDRLFRILLEEGEADAARTAAQAYVAVLEEKGDTATISAVRQEFLTRGQTFEPAAARATLVKRPTFERPLPPPAPVPEPEIVLDDFTAGDTEMSLDLDAVETEMEFDIEEPEELTPSLTEAVDLTPEPAFAIPEAPVAAEPESFEFTEEPEPAWTMPEPEEELTFAATEPEPEPEPELLPDPLEEISFGELEPELVEEPELTSEPDLVAAAEPFFGVEALSDELPAEAPPAEALPAEALPAEEIGEIDFYIQQELFDEARRKVDDLLARFPSSPDLESRRERIEAASIASSAAAAAAIPAPATYSPPALSRAEIESELLSAIPDDDDDLGFVMPASPPPPPPPAAAAAPQPSFSATSVPEDNLFADEEDFFDLAAELESELAEDEEPISLSEEEQSLEEIFKEFKKGVEQQLDSEDYDTHYNLGIAYKEMGLIDEAIGEFQLASKDPKRAVECASMLGLCFLEKGMPQLAIKWYRKGLEMPEITEDEHVGLLYDLGAAYQEVGDTDNAQKAFMEVYGMNSNYRDTVPRIKALEDAKK